MANHPRIVGALIALGVVILFRAAETLGANFGYDWTSVVPRPSAAA